MNTCPHCKETVNQVKAGFTEVGSQRYKCNFCNRRYTPNPKPIGYDASVRQQAIKLYLDGNNQRRTARHVGVSQGSVSNWHREYVGTLPDKAEKPAQPVSVGELDELFTFIGDKKTEFTS